MRLGIVVGYGIEAKCWVVCKLETCAKLFDYIFQLCFFLFDRPRESGENVISCHPVEGSPNKPKNLIAMEAESLKLRHQKITVSY